MSFGTILIVIVARYSGRRIPASSPVEMRSATAAGKFCGAPLAPFINPLKPSVIRWLHFERSVPQRPNLPFSISDIRALWRSKGLMIAPHCTRNLLETNIYLSSHVLWCQVEDQVIRKWRHLWSKMATGSSNWTFDNATVEGAGECNDSLINTTWLDERMYPGQLVDRIVSPIWYLVGVTGQTHHHHFILPTNKNTTFNNTTEKQKVHEAGAHVIHNTIISTHNKD